MTLIFNISFTIYLIALLISVISIFIKHKIAEQISAFILIAGFLSQTIYIILRWHHAGRPPFSNMFESLTLFAWALVLIYLILRIKIKLKALGSAISMLVVLTIAYTSAFKSDIEPLIPALQSNWLTVHVFTCFLGYAGFAISFLTAIGFLFSNKFANSKNNTTTNALETATTKTISFGFLFLSVGIITGAVWANSAWGTYWSWDPKETWSLITWLIYATFLHCRFMRGWRGKRAAWIAIIGFLSVVFTYLGVNLLLSGLHSYN